MMIQLFTPVEREKLPLNLKPGESVISIGSCFADEMARRMKEAGFDVEQNPFGTLYNPASIASGVGRLIEDKEIVESDLVYHEGLFHSWHHHGRFSRGTKEECIEICNESIHRAHNFLKEARVMIVTFGTAWIYELEDGGVVANCHKLPPQNFRRRKMSVEEIEALWITTMDKILRYNEEIKIIFTVSPIRHLADGAHGNQLSKATLLLAEERIVRRGKAGEMFYFPSYEIVMDELRDYRFYADDMTHPTAKACDIIWQRFQEATMTPASIQTAHNNAKKAKREAHIALHG